MKNARIKDERMLSSEDIKATRKEAEKTVDSLTPALVTLMKLVVLPLLILYLLVKFFNRPEEPKSKGWFS